MSVTTGHRRYTDLAWIHIQRLRATGMPSWDEVPGQLAFIDRKITTCKDRING